VAKKTKFQELVDPDHKSVVEEVQARLAYAEQVWEPIWEAAKEDLEFCLPGGHWPSEMREARTAEGRPCLEVDALTPFINQIVNEQRQNRPQPQVNPVGDGATRETAEVLQGMIRHIAYMSDGDVAIDRAYESMVRCGLGYFRVITDYCDDQTFDQEIKVCSITDPCTVVLDPASTSPDGSDAEWGAIATWMPKRLYKSEYPDSKLAEGDDSIWKVVGKNTPDWAKEDGQGCLVVEYFKRIRVPAKVYELEDGTITNQIHDGFVAVRERGTFIHKVLWFKVNAIEILDSTEWPGKYIPIVPVYGNELWLDGKRTISGIVRTAKDPSRFYDFWKTAQAELIALAPKAPWVGPKGFMVNPEVWRAANRKPVAALEYEPYDEQRNPLPPPVRDMAEPPIQAVTAAMMGAAEDLKRATGMYDPVRGINEGGQSGVAIRQLQRQGQVVNYHYMDNLARSVKHLGRILVDLIPKIYDTERVVRIVRPDQTEELVTINAETQDPKTGELRIYDPKLGRYDVTVSVGPGYQTKRQENLALLESLMQGPMGQALTAVAPDLMASMLDFEIAKELQERFKKMLPPQLAEGGKGGSEMPPQAMQQMQQMAQMIEALTQKLNAAQDELNDKEKERLSKERIELYKVRAGILGDLIKIAESEAKAALEAELAMVEADIRAAAEQSAAMASEDGMPPMAPAEVPVPVDMGGMEPLGIPAPDDMAGGPLLAEEEVQ
jgi:hypothetical protein